MAYTRKSSYTPNATYDGKRRFEHWYRDNQIYFITARCRNKFPAFASEGAQAVSWDRFAHYTRRHGFTPIVTTLMNTTITRSGISASERNSARCCKA